MSESLFSDAWYRVADLRPRLRSETRLHHHRYRGQAWYVLQDVASTRHHRLTPAAYTFVGLLDGERTVDLAWQATSDRLGDAALTQPQVVELLIQLHGADLLRGDVTPDAGELFQRAQRFRREPWLRGLLSPLAWRLPLFAPQRLLDRLVPLARPVIGWSGLLLWLAVVLPAAALALLHWQELSADVLDRILAPTNLLLLLLVYPAVKALHELAHGLVTRHWGGEVHEAGLMFLAFIPLPYVNASAAAAFPDKFRRMAVGAAGILTESFLAALAFLVWLLVEPGLIRLVAYDVMLIGGISTLAFNGNPLMRFDGYHVLADALEIPNLAGRSNRYYTYLAHRYLFGLTDARSPVQARGERAWFIGYGAAAFAWRLFVTGVILLLIASQSLTLGVLVGLWAFVGLIVIPLGKAAQFILASPRLASRRPRALLSSAALTVCLFTLVFALPAPLHTRAEGVVRVPDHAWVRAGTDGFVEQVLVTPGAPVEEGDVLLVMEDAELTAKAAVETARLAELRAQLTAVSFADPARADILRQEIAAAESTVALSGERLAALTVRSAVTGRFVFNGRPDVEGRYLHRGEVLGYVLADGTPTVRVVVDQDHVALVRDQTRHVEVKLASAPRRTLAARIAGEVPAADHELPSASLGSSAGGAIAVDPRDEQGTQSLQTAFKFDLALPTQDAYPPLGIRAHVRFDHGYETLGEQWYRALRQLLLTRLAV